MKVDLELLAKNIKELGLPMVLHVERKTFGSGEDAYEALQVDIWSINGFLKGDSENSIPLIIGDTSGSNNLGISITFCTPKLFDYGPDELAVFMDANGNTQCKGYRWNPNDNGVSYSYCLPLDNCKVPTPDMLRFILTQIYDGLFFPQIRSLLHSIAQNPVCSDDEKQAQQEKVMQAHARVKGEIDDMAI